MSTRGVVLSIHLLKVHKQPPLPRGTLLRIGEATLELTGPCEPCEVIGTYNAAADPYALRDALRGRRGMMSKVIAVTGEGRIRRGDDIVRESPRPTEPAAT